MTQPQRIYLPDVVGARAPVAIVALGDSDHHDEALPARVVGRARTLLAEIGRLKWGEGGPGEASNASASASASASAAASASVSSPMSVESESADGCAQLSLGLDGSLALAAVPQSDRDWSAPPIVDWIEAGGASARLDAVLAGRRRVVLVDTLSLVGKPGTVYHWHLERGVRSLGFVQHYHRSPRLGFEHLAFWLEDDVPAGGLDLIGIEPGDTSQGEGLSSSVRRRLATISSQVTAILVRILAEEGW